MTTLLVCLVLLAAVVGVTLVVLRARWDTGSFDATVVELLARNTTRPRSAKALREALLRSVNSASRTSLSGQRAVLPSMAVRISPEDASRLHPAGDVGALGREASALYLDHARGQGWQVDATPIVRIETDHRLRPGWVPPPRPTSLDRPSPRPDEAATQVVPAVGDPERTDVIAPATELIRPPLVIEYQGSSYAIMADILGLGRKHNDHFALSEKTASFRHALLQRTADGWTVRDLDSTNGTYLDGQRVGSAPVPLPARADLSLGDARLVVHTS